MSGPHCVARNGVGTCFSRVPCGRSDMYASRLFCKYDSTLYIIVRTLAPSFPAEHSPTSWRQPKNKP